MFLSRDRTLVIAVSGGRVLALQLVPALPSHAGSPHTRAGWMFGLSVGGGPGKFKNSIGEDSSTEGGTVFDLYSEDGFGVLAGLGYEFRLTRRFALGAGTGNQLSLHQRRRLRYGAVRTDRGRSQLVLLKHAGFQMGATPPRAESRAQRVASALALREFAPETG